MPADDIYLKDGTVYRGVSAVREAGGVFLFEYQGQARTLSKYRIDRILGANGGVIYQERALTAAKRSLDDGSTEFVFSVNGEEVARGSWRQDGSFRVTHGNPPDGVYKVYFDTGQIEQEFPLVDGRIHGLSRIFYKSGRVEREGTFANGREHGVSRMFYRSGALKGESTYVDGKKHGETRLYYESGQPKSVMEFREGEAEGRQRMFYESGQLEVEVAFEDGKKHGPIQQYFESGKLRLEGNYRQDKLDGEVTVYYESGRVKKRQVFVAGRVLQ